MSGVPGLRVIADARQNPWRRACWLLAFGALACLMVMDLSYIFAEFLRYEDVVSITYTEPARAGFPAVTVCNVNKVRKSVLCQAGAPVGLNDTVFYRWRDLLCNSSNRNIAMSKEDLKLSRELTDWVQVTQSDKRYRGFLLGHKMEDVLQSCVLNGEDCRALNLLDHKSVPSFGSCFCVGCNPGIRYQYPSNRAKQSLNGLHMLLNVQLEEYLPLTVDAGFLIMIHHPWAEEDITQDVTFVAPGTATFISVLLSVFSRLKAPYKNPCRDDWPPELRAHVDKNNLYTAFECRDYCVQTHVFSECGCVSHRFLRPLIGELSEADICAIREKSELCEKEVEKKMKEGRISCNCIAACRDIIYKTSTSSLSLGQSRVSKGNQTSWSRNKLQAKVTIYKRTSKTHHRTRTPNYKVANFLSRIGGTLGLYLGLSSLVLFSLVDAIYRSILARLTRRVRHHSLAQINP